MDVDREGNFELKGDPRILYQGMVATRITLLQASFECISRAAVISTRYAVCRRQFKTLNASSEERKLLDYQTHTAIIAPHVASQFMILFLTKRITELV